MCQFALTIPALERQKQEDLSSLQTSKSNLIHIQRANLSQKRKAVNNWRRHSTLASGMCAHVRARACACTHTSITHNNHTCSGWASLFKNNLVQSNKRTEWINFCLSLLKKDFDDINKFFTLKMVHHQRENTAHGKRQNICKSYSDEESISRIWKQTQLENKQRVL